MNSEHYRCSEWKKVFAFFPTKLRDGTIAWLCWIYRADFATFFANGRCWTEYKKNIEHSVSLSGQHY